MRDVTLFGRSRFLGGRRPRAAVIILVLLLTLVVAGALAYQAQHAARSHRTTAENVLRDYATFASWEFWQSGRRVLNEVLGIQLARLAATCKGQEGVPDVRQWVQQKDG